MAEPHVDAKIARTSIERGKTATLVCKLDPPAAVRRQGQGDPRPPAARHRAGRADAEITSADKEVTFTLRATPEALVGNYQGVVLDLTVIDNGQADPPAQRLRPCCASMRNAGNENHRRHREHREEDQALSER